VLDLFGDRVRIATIELIGDGGSTGVLGVLVAPVDGVTVVGKVTVFLFTLPLGVGGVGAGV
jgi:hypothetical protein